MGRKRWWRGGLELLLLCILHHADLTDGDVGEYTLYRMSLCNTREKNVTFCKNYCTKLLIEKYGYII